MKVMVNGLPGNMATIAAKKVLREDGLELVLYSLTGPEIEQTEYSVEGNAIILIKPEDRESIIETIEPDEGFISVDYTHPSAVNDNADFYCRYGLNFVMGTTGGDRDALEARVKNSDIVAVIAPNMAKQIVGFQAMMEYAAENFQGLFGGYKLDIVESHQKGKADTSGTAKAMVRYFNKMGVPFEKEQINMVRSPDTQKVLGVPEAYLGGHGWHTYTLTSPDGNVFFRFTHNVNGREIYGDGTIDAIQFLRIKIQKGEEGKVYSMIDVLKGK